MIRFNHTLRLMMMGLGSLAIAYPLWAQTPSATTQPTTGPAATQPHGLRPPLDPKLPPPDVAAVKLDGNHPQEYFMNMHKSFLERANQGPIDVLFIGDSITEWWKNAPKVFDKHYGKIATANFGIAGDQTQHVLWRIENGELDHISPKVVVFLLGTNNFGYQAEQIAAADTKVIQEIRTKLPEARILVLAIFPRGDDPKNPDVAVIRSNLADASLILSKLDDGEHIRYLDINARFLDAKGRIPKDLMGDALHPTAKGYEVWAKAMQPLLDEMLKQK